MMSALEQADDLVVGGDRLALKNSTFGLRDDPLDQRAIVTDLGVPRHQEGFRMLRGEDSQKLSRMLPCAGGRGDFRHAA
jgi:hypothetical protein